MSTKSGRAPAWLIASVVAMNVCGTVTTMSPAWTPAAISANRTASVPLLTPTQCAVSQNLANSRLKFLQHRAADEPRRPQRLLDNRKQFPFEFLMQRCQIQEWNFCVIRH